MMLLVAIMEVVTILCNGSKNGNYSNSRNVSIRRILMIMIGMIAAKSFPLT